MRRISEEEIRDLKSQTENSYRLGGGVANFDTRVDTPTLSKYASKNDENLKTLIPIDIAIEADRRAQSPAIISAAARMLGYRLVPDNEQLDDMRAISDTDLVDLMKEFSDVITAITEHKRAGTLGAAHAAKHILKEIHEAKRELLELERNSTVKPAP